MSNPRYLSFNGEIVPYADAKVHVLTPGLKYGAGVFEGIRAYWNDRRQQLFVFRLKEHLDRLQFSMKVMRFQHELTNDIVEHALLDVIRANEQREDLHIRPLVWVDGDGDITSPGPTGWMVASLTRPPNPAVRVGIHCGVTSWRRISDTSTPARVKATSNYSNGRLAGMQGKIDGYDNVLFLTQAGHVAESPGSCFMMVRDGKLITPGVTSSILESITRATVMTLGRNITGHDVVERDIDRTELYLADEAFFCGSGQEIQPILSMDRHDIGKGVVGPITQTLQEQYFATVRGETNTHSEWLTPVYKS
jgi:branched-chain amino acid aminotransferase